MKAVMFVVACALLPQANSARAQETPTTATRLAAHRLAPQTPAELRALLTYKDRPLPIVSAHRGGPAVGLPENCIATFEATLEKSFALLEIDPRLTKDGEVVVLHDPSLDRTTTGTGLVAEHTWEQLKELRLKDTLGKVTDYSIPTLDQAIEWARGKTVLILDQKDTPLATRIKKITDHRAESYVLMIVGKLEEVQTCYRLNPQIMMEVYMGDRDKFEQFAQSGVPWQNIVAFVGHTSPEDQELLRMIHAKGALCIAGTSRNIDLELNEHDGQANAEIEVRYRRLLNLGIDIIETDLPRQVGPLLYASQLGSDQREDSK